MARSLKLSSMFAYRRRVNKQLQQLYMNHSYWLSTKCLTKIKILVLRKSQDKTLVYGFIALTYTYLQWPVFGLPQMKSEVTSTAIHVGFVVDKAKNGQAFLRLFSRV
jgi:chloramphenicol O-acetyltransferase